MICDTCKHLQQLQNSFYCNEREEEFYYYANCQYYEEDMND